MDNKSHCDLFNPRVRAHAGRSCAIQTRTQGPGLFPINRNCFVFIADPLAGISHQKRRVQVGREGSVGKSCAHSSYQSRSVSILPPPPSLPDMVGKCNFFFFNKYLFWQNLFLHKYCAFYDELALILYQYVDINHPLSDQCTTISSILTCRTGLRSPFDPFEAGKLQFYLHFCT